MIAACSSWKWAFFFMSIAWLIAMVTLFLVNREMRRP